MRCTCRCVQHCFVAVQMNGKSAADCLIVSDAVHVNVPKLNSIIFPCHFSLSKIAHIANTYCHIYIQKANRY